MKSRSLFTILASALLSVATSGFAATWDEGANGTVNPLSNNYMAPTPFTFTTGSNTIKGRVTANQDYITFTVPAGSVISSLTLDSYTTSGTAANVSFFAIAPGSSSPIAPPGATAAGLLGWILFNASNIGSNILPTIGTAGSGATGFTPPLPPGTYTFWIQDTAQTVDYQISFNITATPAAPVVKVTGKAKITTTKTKVKLKGTVAGSVTKVEYRVGAKGAFKPATGTTSWTINASKLKPGKNVVTIQVTGVGGTVSTKVTVTVKKKK